MEPIIKSTLFIGTLTVAASCAQLTAAGVSLDFTRDVRVISGTANSRDDNNGGSDKSALIGIADGIDSYQIYDFDFSGLAGQTVSGDATLTFDLSTHSTGSFSGSTRDTIWVRALFNDNAGWVEGNQAMGGYDNQSNNGSASFLNRVQYDDDPGPAAGTTTPWLDDSGSSVSNLLGALTGNLDSVAGVVDSNRPGTRISFTISQATVQSWIDGGFAGIVVGATDGDDGASRFRTDNANLSYVRIPEPGIVGLIASALLPTLILRRRQ